MRNLYCVSYFSLFPENWDCREMGKSGCDLEMSHKKTQFPHKNTRSWSPGVVFLFCLFFGGSNIWHSSRISIKLPSNLNKFTFHSKLGMQPDCFRFQLYCRDVHGISGGVYSHKHRKPLKDILTYEHLQSWSDGGEVSQESNSGIVK